MRSWFLSLVVLGGCQGRLLNINIEGESSVVIPEGTLVEDLVIDLGFGDFLNMDLTQSQELQNQGVEPEDIVDVFFTSFTLETVSPEGSDMSFLEAMTLSVDADALQPVEVAEAPGFPQGESLVAFDLYDVDIADYVVSEAMDITTDVTGRRPEQDTEIRATYAVRVGVTLKGAFRKRD